jgi:hypothetical protein
VCLPRRAELQHLSLTTAMGDHGSRSSSETLLHYFMHEKASRLLPGKLFRTFRRLNIARTKGSMRLTDYWKQPLINEFSLMSMQTANRAGRQTQKENGTAENQFRLWRAKTWSLTALNCCLHPYYQNASGGQTNYQFCLTTSSSPNDASTDAQQRGAQKTQKKRKEKKTTDRHRQTEKKPKTQSKTVGLLINSHS